MLPAGHQRIALQLSGGKDSVACLYLLREYLDRITVYHLNTGDQPPETKAVIAECRKIIPHYMEINTDSLAWISGHGLPSDVVPTHSTALGLLSGMGTLPLADRFACCWANLMEPMHQRMQADGITLLIRGTKLCDMPHVPIRSGEVMQGVEFYSPIENWTDADVMAYLREQNAPVHPVYAALKGGIDCLHCTAWWDENHLRWMKTAHPKAAAWVRAKHIEIRAAVTAQLSHMEQ